MRTPGAEDPLELFHPAVAAWFREAFPEGPTEAQRAAWPRITRGESVLLVSPTGTGKTLAAFLVALDGLVRRRLSGDGERQLSVLYVSPLKALDNDVHRNLEAPKQGIRRHLAARHEGALHIETAVRTGDTSAAVRAAQLRHPPDILITTPESLYLMLTGAGRRIFGSVSTLILDEVHSIAGTKRGAHLALTLERLEWVIEAAGGRSPARVALSATVAPPARVAELVGGAGRKVTPLVVSAPKALDLRVLSPAREFGKEEGSAWGPAIDAIAAEVASRKTTLVFCNNRRQAERVAALLEERLGTKVPAHHGSVARAPREEIERDLKAGRLKALVATGSLELGIDVGEVETVVQVSSPRGIARALQRVGRSGHLVGATSRGRFIPLHVDDLLECAATVEGMHERDVEETRPPEFPLDVLAQQLVAETVARAADPAGPPPTADGFWVTFRRASPYRSLSRRLFDETLAMLSGKYPKERFAELAPKLVWDRATGRLAPLPAARLAALLDGGTIGDRGTFRAVLPDRKTVVGELDEEFVYETRVGDVFLLGSRAWRATEIAHDRVLVEDATGQPARMPFWRGEGVGRSPKLGERVGRLKRLVAERLDDASLPDLLRGRYGCDDDAAAALVAAVRREATEPGGVSSERRVVFESFPNDLGDPCVVVRSVFGRGVNLPWSLALASVLREETGVDVASVTSDDGILLRAPRCEREIPLERLARLTAAEARERLLVALPNSPMFGARFRENAQRALLLPRARTGRRTPFWLQRLKAKDLLQTTRSLPDFPIVAETYRDCLKDLWEYDRLLQLLEDVAAGRVETVPETRRFPSAAASRLLFSFIAVYMYEWDAPRAEKGIHALAMNRELLGEVLGEPFDDGIRPEAVEQVRAEASRVVPHRMARDADELLLVFQELGDLTREEARERCLPGGAGWLAELAARGSLLERTIAGRRRWIAAEEAPLFDALDTHPPDPECLRRVLLRFLSTRGPAETEEVSLRYGLPAARVAEALEELRQDGLAVSGRFGEGPNGPTRWAGARLAQAIRRRTLGILRREIRPVRPEVFRAFLARRQGVELGHRFAGPHAAERAVGQLRGLALPALAWETALLPARLAEPEPDALDVLSAQGLLVWGARGTKDVRAARLLFFLRGEGRLVLPEALPDLERLSSPARRLYEQLAVAGASFALDLAAATSLDGRELARALVELVLAGVVTGDGLHGLRDLLRGIEGASAPVPSPRAELGRHPGRAELREAERRVAGRLGSAPRRAPSGRWSLLLTPSVLGADLRSDERAEAWARILLARWGVVFRDLLAREESPVSWSEVAPALARMELRGDLRRGEFIAGGGPLQYGEEEVVETLRSRAAPAPREESALAVAGGADPVLYGLDPPPSRDEWVVLSDGGAALRLTRSGELTLGAAVNDAVLKRSLQALTGLVRSVRDPLGRPRRLSVASVGGRPAAGAPIGPLLEAAGFRRDAGGYVFRAL